MNASEARIASSKANERRLKDALNHTYEQIGLTSELGFCTVSVCLTNYALDIRETVFRDLESKGYSVRRNGMYILSVSW